MQYLNFFHFSHPVLDSGEECHGMVYYTSNWSIVDHVLPSTSYFMVL